MQIANVIMCVRWQGVDLFARRPIELPYPLPVGSDLRVNARDTVIENYGYDCDAGELTVLCECVHNDERQMAEFHESEFKAEVASLRNQGWEVGEDDVRYLHPHPKAR